MSKARRPRINISTFMPGMNTAKSDISRIIGSAFGPAVFKNEKMRTAGLGARIATGEFMTKLNSDMKPDGQKYIYFELKDDGLSKDEICDFFNEVCGGLGLPFTPIKADDLIDVATGIDRNEINKTQKSGKPAKDPYTYYAFDITPYETVEMSVEDKEAADVLKKMLDDDCTLGSLEPQLLIGDKAKLSATLSKDAADELENGEYLLLSVKKDLTDGSLMAELANDINKKVGGKISGREFVETDAIKVEGGDKFKNKDVFVFKVG